MVTFPPKKRITNRFRIIPLLTAALVLTVIAIILAVILYKKETFCGIVRTDV